MCFKKSLTQAYCLLRVTERKISWQSQRREPGTLSLSVLLRVVQESDRIQTSRKTLSKNSAGNRNMRNSKGKINHSRRHQMVRGLDQNKKKKKLGRTSQGSCSKAWTESHKPILLYVADQVMEEDGSVSSNTGDEFSNFGSQLFSLF